jgi:hypothetical protein
MQRAHGGTDAAAAAAVATVTPLLQLRRAAEKAEKLARFSRAVELCERALAAAEVAQPRGSLIVASLLDELVNTRFRSPLTKPEGIDAAEATELKVRSLHLLHARWQAGTLFTPTAEEVAFYVENEEPHLPAQMCGAYTYIRAAEDVLQLQHFVPQACMPRPAEAEARLQSVCGALRAALDTDARGMLERNPRTGRAWPASSAAALNTVSSFLKAMVHSFVTFVLSEAGLVLPMRVRCGLTAAEETALRQLAARHKAVAQRRLQEFPEAAEGHKAKEQQAAAADVARHGLRRCALPSCDAQEPHPKLFKLCGRCRGAAYCCATHSAEDWKRHKREDGCAAAP